MKTKLFTLLVAAILISSISYGKTFRLNFVSSSYYTGTAVTGVDYTTSTVTALMTAAADGDTVQVYPFSSGSVTVSKRLVWIGVGYFTSGTSSNPDLNIITASSVGTTTFTLQGSASNSVFTGLDNIVVFIPASTTVDNIIIKGCNINNIQMSTNALATNWQVLKCYGVYFYPNSSPNNFNNLRVENSQFGGSSSFSSTSTGVIRNCISEASSSFPIIFNGSAFVLENNILNYVSNFLACTFNNNIFFQTQTTYPNLTGSNNQFNVTQAILFTSPNASTETKYQLKAGSPAVGAGVSGVDIGIFGGLNPYKLSGIPPTPSIYKLTSTSIQTSGNPYTITFSSRSNN